MVLLDPALMNAAMAAGFHDMITPLIEMHAAGRSAEAVELWMSAGNADWKAFIEPRIPGVVAQAIADAAGTFDFDLRAMRVWDFEAVGASGISQPLLYATGTRSGHPPSIAAMFQNAVQHARGEELPDADHIVPMTDPSAVAAVVAAFLHSQPAGSDPTPTNQLP
jgi:pimeloyl-ACP methyl ester carboxylesterase